MQYLPYKINPILCGSEERNIPLLILPELIFFPFFFRVSFLKIIFLYETSIENSNFFYLNNRKLIGKKHNEDLKI